MSKRTLLLGVAGLLSAAALFAIVILLVGHFGRTEARILGTTGVLAAFAVVALPATILLEQGRARRLAATLVAFGAVTAALYIISIWWTHMPEAIGRATVNATVLTLATAQTAAVCARRRDGDPGSVRRLFVASIALAAVVLGMVTVLVWAHTESSGFGRVLGAVVILDLLTVALQPILARARPVTPMHRLVVTLTEGKIVVLDVEAPDLGAATAKAIRSLQSEGHGVALIQVGTGAHPGPDVHGDRRQTALSGV